MPVKTSETDTRRRPRPGSLAVPLSVVLDRVHEYLQERQSKAPLFLYVNFHDTHYPYNHPGLENLLGVDLLPPSQISASRRVELLRTYLNATSNVDRAIGTVIGTVEERLRQGRQSSSSVTTARACSNRAFWVMVTL